MGAVNVAPMASKYTFRALENNPQHMKSANEDGLPRSQSLLSSVENALVGSQSDDMRLADDSLASRRRTW